MAIEVGGAPAPVPVENAAEAEILAAMPLAGSEPSGAPVGTQGSSPGAPGAAAPGASDGQGPPNTPNQIAPNQIAGPAPSEDSDGEAAAPSDGSSQATIATDSPPEADRPSCSPRSAHWSARWQT